MTTTSLSAPIRINTARVSRASAGHLVAVRAAQDGQRPGRLLAPGRHGGADLGRRGGAPAASAARADHTFQSVLDAGLQPAAVLLPVVGILLGQLGVVPSAPG